MDGSLVSRHALQRHLRAPLLREREAYLQHLKRSGASRRRIHFTASMLVHAVRLLGLQVPRQVSPGELEAAAQAWCAESDGPTSNRPSHSRWHFDWMASGFLRHVGLLAQPTLERGKFADFLEAYETELLQRRLAKRTVAGRLGIARRFLQWLSPRRNSLRETTTADLDAYTEAQRKVLGTKTYTTMCLGLRAFFAEGEKQGWCSGDLKRAIVPPRLSSAANREHRVTWAEVRAMLQAAPDRTASDLRTKAILYLCALYALRGGEVARLRTDSIDWQRGVFSIVRGKRGRLQHFPLHPDVAAVLRAYLDRGRPHSDDPSLLQTIYVPHRALTSAAISNIVTSRLLRFTSVPRLRGAHALRHACASQLLNSGFTLREIADFFGHRSLKTVSLYVQHEVTALEEVARFELDAR